MFERFFRRKSEEPSKRKYRPVLMPMPSGDELADAGVQAALDQKLEAAVDTRDGEQKELIYEAARITIEATEILGIKRGRSKSERDLDVERMATGIAFGLNIPDLDLRRRTVELCLEPFIQRGTNAVRRKFIDEKLIPITYRAHGLESPQPKR